jgi:two-component system sensor histidine kinase RpfC
MSDLLMDSGLDARQQGLARTIQNSAGTLLGIIENILDFSKIEAGRILIEEIDFDLHQLTADIVQMFKPQALRKGLRLGLIIDPRIPFQLRGDSLHLRQILTNLLSNAVKFTEQGRVDLRLGLVRADHGWIKVRFEIEDTGIGIPVAEQGRIFESFRQADSSITRRFGGTGLGTAIARELTHLLGGQIGLESEVGRGTLFWVELSLSVSRTAPVDPAESLGNVRVLVVGSHNAYAKLRRTLDDWRVESQSVPTCARAFAALVGEAAQGRRFSGVLAVAGDLDLRPDQFAAGIRGESVLQETSLVLLDASPSLGSAPALRDTDFSAVLSAPLDKTLLLNAIHVARSAQDVPDNVVSLADYYSHLVAAPHQGLSILIAEDNETNRIVLQGILERAGHRVTIVGDGEAALDALESPDQHFDLMILDKNMPGRSGLDVFRAYRFMVPRNPIPGIILSADATPEALLACKEAGVDAYLTKPVETHRLLATIAQLSKRAECATEETAPANQEANTTSFDVDSLVDVAKLRALLDLGGDSSFFEDLVAGFLRDSRRSLQKMAAALQDRDYPMLREAIHALRGSASELGATHLVALCATLRTLKPFELGTPRAVEMLDTMQHAYSATASLLTDFQHRDRETTAE